MSQLTYLFDSPQCSDVVSLCIMSATIFLKSKTIKKNNMLNKLFKKESQQVQTHEAGFKKPEEYYGRFSLSEVDDCVDDIQLRKWTHEIQLDFDNNKIRFQQCQEINYKKRMNFCKFFLYRINERLEEIRRIKSLSHNASSKIRKSSPERWQLMVKAIIERYPGVDLQHIINIIDKEY